MTTKPTALPPDHVDRLARAAVALDGLSVGDAFGNLFFRFNRLRIRARALPEGPWSITDDTEMALSIMEVLTASGRIEQDDLARRFGRRYEQDPWRGYGGTARGLLTQMAQGIDWRVVTRKPFDGLGSMGNGGAMRVAPLGAYFADDLPTVVEQARLSAEVTHFHPEGQAGAVAIAVAAAVAHSMRGRLTPSSGPEMLRTVADLTPPGETRAGIEKAIGIDPDYDVETAAAALGNGSRITAPDTVPFCLWSAARSLGSYVEAMWTTVEAEGDVDTNCAIVGGIVALSAGGPDIPKDWLAAREPLPKEFVPSET